MTSQDVLERAAKIKTEAPSQLTGLARLKEVKREKMANAKPKHIDEFMLNFFVRSFQDRYTSKLEEIDGEEGSQ